LWIQVPQTVSNFKAMCTGTAGSSFEGTIFHRVLQGQYIQAGRQGLKEKGEVASPAHLDRNEDSIRSNSFKLKHTRPGTVSLCLSENDDEEGLKLSGDYRNVEFLITTGLFWIEILANQLFSGIHTNSWLEWNQVSAASQCDKDNFWHALVGVCIVYRPRACTTTG